MLLGYIWLLGTFVNSSCDIKINVNIVQNCCRNLAVRGLRVLARLHRNLLTCSLIFPFLHPPNCATGSYVATVVPHSCKPPFQIPRSLPSRDWHNVLTIATIK